MEVIPYLASIAWYALWLNAIINGASTDEAIRIANLKGNISGKDFTRCRIKGTSSETFLSIPVEGGASRLKRTSNIPYIDISEHGNWRHTHMGAINAAYGRTPYYLYHMPMLESVYKSGERSLKKFNEMMHSAVICMLFGDGNPDEILRTCKSMCLFPHYTPVKERGLEIAQNIDSNISIIDLLMTHGRVSLLPLLSTLNS